MELKTISVTGNHDLAYATGDTCGFNLYAKEAVEWARKIIKDKNVEFLRNLKPKIRLRMDNISIVMVHGGPMGSVNEYIFPHTHDSTLKSFLEFENADIHIHFIEKLEDKLVFNPGSVG